MRKRYLMPIMGIIVGMFLISIPTFALGTTAVNWFNHTSLTSGPFEEVNQEFGEAINSLSIKGANIKNIDISFHDKTTTIINGKGDLTEFEVNLEGPTLVIRTKKTNWNSSLFRIESLNTEFEFERLSVILPSTFINGTIDVEALVSDIKISGNESTVLKEIEIDTLSSNILLENLDAKVEFEGFNLNLASVNSGGHWDINAVNFEMHSDLLTKSLQLEYNVANYDGTLITAPESEHHVVMSGLNIKADYKNERKHAIGGLSFGNSGQTGSSVIVIDGEGVSQRLIIK